MMHTCEHGHPIDCVMCLKAEIDKLLSVGEVVLEKAQRQEAELDALKEKARAAVNAPYDDILDMGLAQALRELKETINDPE